MKRHMVVFHVDNQALVAALNKGSCKQASTQALIRRIYTIAAQTSFSLRSEWLSSSDNARADRLSCFISVIPDAAHRDNPNPDHFDPDSIEYDGDPAHLISTDDDYISVAQACHE
jgi:hypothetical protein